MRKGGEGKEGEKEERKKERKGKTEDEEEERKGEIGNEEERKGGKRTGQVRVQYIRRVCGGSVCECVP